MGCIDCTDMYLNDRGTEPPCGECYVELLPENKKPWKLFMLCQDQVRRAGMNGTIVGLDNAAIITTMELYGEGENLTMFEDIKICSEIKQELVG